MFNNSTSQNQPTLEKRNTTSLDGLKASQGGSIIDFQQGQGAGAGKLFFVCGSVQGYVSAKAKAILEQNASNPGVIKNDLEYAEIKIVDAATGEITWLPTIYPKNKKSSLCQI